MSPNKTLLTDQLRCLRILALALLLMALAPAHAALADSAAQAFAAADSREWPQAMRAAQRSGEPALPTYVQWRMLRDSSHRQPVDAYLRFLARYPDWPERDVVGRRTAEAMLLQGYTSSQETQWKQQLGKKEAVFSYGWEQGRFHGNEQNQLLARYGKQLNTTAIEARIDALLWNKQTGAAASLLPRSSRNFRRIAEARIAFITRAKDAGSKRRKLSTKQQINPALLFARVDYHYRKKQHSQAEQLLKQAPNAVPQPHKWWKYWRYYAREALGDGRISDAYAVLKPITQAETGSMAQLFWLRGWIQLHFRNNPRQAYEDFYTFYKHVGTPISLARGAYWAGLAAQKNGSDSIAQNWLREAQKWPMSFYGQTAFLTDQANRRTALPVSRDSVSPSKPRGLRQQSALIRLLARHKQDYSVEAFILNLAARYPDASSLLAIARFAQQLNHPHLGIRLAKNNFSEQKQWVQAVAHPVIDLPRNLAVEPALAMAIIRQESEFDPNARSHADARGLMQLLPSTARSVARKAGIKTTTAKLYQPQHNIRLGSLYLAGLLEQFNGTLPLAIASYNAGPGRVHEWLKRFGAFPHRGNLNQQLKWLEQIPFSETRNYVQRVMENYRVYQKLLNHNATLSPQTAFHLPVASN